MKTKTKNILIVSSIVVGGVGVFLLIKKLRKPKLSDEEERLLEQMANSNKGGSSSTSSGGGGSSNTPSLSYSVESDKIYKALENWTTDNDEKIIVDTILNFNSSTLKKYYIKKVRLHFKNLEKYFNTKYSSRSGSIGGFSLGYKNPTLKEWLEDDLSDENYAKIKNIVG